MYSYIFYYFLLLVSCENTDKQNTIDIDLSKNGFMYRIFHVCKIGRESGLAHNRRSTDYRCRTFVF